MPRRGREVPLFTSLQIAPRDFPVCAITCLVESRPARCIGLSCIVSKCAGVAVLRSARYNFNDMGRLGRVQKWILFAAWNNDASYDEPDLVYAEIMAEYFGMPWTHEPRGEWGQKFAKSKLKNYAKVSATISRAVHLLADRGLVTVTRGQPVGAYRSRPLSEKEIETRQLDVLPNGQEELELQVALAEALVKKGAEQRRLLEIAVGRYEEGKSIASKDTSNDDIYFSTRYGWRANPSREVLGRAEIRLTDEGVEVARHLPTQKPKAKSKRGQSVR